MNPVINPISRLLLIEPGINSGISTPPTIQASDIVITDITSTTLTFNYTNGNGSSRIVLMKSVSAVNSDPVDGVEYTANSIFGSGSQIGTGNYVVKLGSGPVTVTGLSADTVYHIAIYEFNGNGGSTNYLQTSPAVSNEYTFTTQYQSVLTYAAGVPCSPPSLLYDKKQENTLIKGLVTDLDFALADQIFNFETYGDRVYAKINVKNPGTKNALEVGTLTFTPGRGFVPSAGGYIRTQFTPSTDGVNFTQNSGGYILYIPSVDALSTADLLGAGGAANLHAIHLRPRGTGNLFNYRLNEATAISGGNSATEGLWSAIRTASNALTLSKDTTSLSSSTQASTGLSTREIYLGTFNANGTPGVSAPNYLGFWMIGGAFNRANVYTRHLTYLTEIVTQVSFDTWTNFSNDHDQFITGVSSFENIMNDDPLSVNVIQELIGSTITAGGNNFQGGALAANDCIYYCVSTGTDIIKFNTLTEAVTRFGTIAAGTQKFLTNIYHPNGKVYHCPFYATSIMTIDTLNSDAIAYFDTTGALGSISGNLTGDKKWSAIIIGSDGRLYFVPYDSNTVMIVDPTTHAIQFMDTTGIVSYNTGNLTDAAKWDGGVAWKDKIFGVTSTATDILKINTHATTPSCSRICTLAAGANKYAIATLGYDDIIYFFPYNGTDIQPFNPTTETLGTAFGSFTGSSPKCGGKMVLPDGKILTNPVNGTYSILYNPGDASAVQITNTFASGNGAIGSVQAKNGAGYSAGAKILKSYYEHKTVTYEEDFVLSRYVNGVY